MKAIAKQRKKRAAFTIVELLTVMSIIVILIGLLVPALSQVRKFALKVKQNAQFHSIEAAIELFNNEFEGYPESAALDPMGLDYCGAMKLCEAMMGQDMLGFHSSSLFKRNGTDNGNPSANPPVPSKQLYFDPTADLTARKGPYLPPESADAVEIGEIWTTNTGNFDAKSRVLCDVYTQRLDSGKKVGMPILYYKADTSGKAKFHDAGLAAAMTPFDNQGNIYNCLDNQFLLDLGIPNAAGQGSYDLKLPERFYQNTKSDKVATVMDRPFKADTYILISPGYDAEYGTADDIMNFDWKYSETIQ